MFSSVAGRLWDRPNPRPSYGRQTLARQRREFRAPGRLVILAAMDAEPFTRWLREQLAAAGISQREASRRAGLSDSAVNDYLNGRRRPLPEACRKLAHTFGVAEDVVLALAGHRSIPVGGDSEFFLFLREQPPDLLAEIERWVRPYVRAYWEQRREERPRATRPELSIQLRWEALAEDS
jgi:transcriptional regulator with XRE-family HTH domain